MDVIVIVGIKLGIFRLFSAVEPYMDELFHYPQTVEYIRGHYQHWDPKITTAPGLYIFPALFQTKESIHYCRLWNVLFGFLTFLLLRTTRSRLEAWSISLFPISFFFNFLYYTDSGSTLFVLLGWKFGSHRQYLASAISLFCSIWFRQTNAIWTVFIGLLLSIDSLDDTLLSSYNGLTQTILLLFRYLAFLVVDIKRQLKIVGFHVIVVLSFLIFVVKNGSIVLGDKQNHQATFHLPQVFYFFAFTFGFGFFALEPWLIVPQLLKSIWKNKFLSLVLLIVLWFGCRYYTIAHPFLLADNRHYTFYLWRYFLSKQWIRFALIPVYFISIVTVLYRLNERKALLWILGVLVSTCLCLIPSPLIEFRYYIIPFLIVRLQLKPKRTSLYLEAVFYVAINAVTMYLFLYRPFEWKHEVGIQRFMW